jgi:hypothetical protein
MRASLNFTLPDDQYEFDAALSGIKALQVLSEIDNHCRSILKWSEPSADVQEALTEIRGMIPGELLDWHE